MDAAHLLPLLGVLLVILPLLRNSEAEPASTSSAILYLFGVWSGLVLLSAMFSRLLKAQNLLKEQKELDQEQGDAP